MSIIKNNLVTNSNSSNSISLCEKALGWLLPSLLAANAATYSQVGTLITVSSTAHSIPATIHNGKKVYLDAATGTLVDGWFDNFTYVDANTFTCQSSISQTISGTLTTKTGVAVIISDLTCTIPAGSMGPNGKIKFSYLASHLNSAGTKVSAILFGGQTVHSSSQSTTATLFTAEKYIWNRNSLALQVIAPTAVITPGTSTSAPVRLSVDTSPDVAMTISLTLNTVSEYAAIEAYTVILMPN